VIKQRQKKEQRKQAPGGEQLSCEELQEDLLLLIQAPHGTTIDIPVEQYQEQLSQQQPHGESQDNKYNSQVNLDSGAGGASGQQSQDTTVCNNYKLFITAPKPKPEFSPPGGVGHGGGFTSDSFIRPEHQIHVHPINLSSLDDNLDDCDSEDEEEKRGMAGAQRNSDLHDGPDMGDSCGSGPHRGRGPNGDQMQMMRPRDRV